jgi:hypothetical protein
VKYVLRHIFLFSDLIIFLFKLNHQFSPYIAEMANTFSNLFTVGIALCGWREARLEGLPERFVVGYAVRSSGQI